jgi:formylglycine-generating enzyme required for sulfatase activity
MASHEEIRPFVMVSCGTAERAALMPLLGALTETGLKLVIDPPGPAVSIGNALKACGCVLICLSNDLADADYRPRSRRSPWFNELEDAGAFEKAVVCALDDASTPGLPGPIRRLPTHQFGRNLSPREFASRVTALSADIKKVMARTRRRSRRRSFFGILPGSSLASAVAARANAALQGFQIAGRARVALAWAAGTVMSLALIGTGLIVMALADEEGASRLSVFRAGATAVLDKKDMRLVAMADSDGMTRVYSGRTLVGTIRGHDAPVEQIEFLDGGNSILTADAAGRVQVTALNSIASRDLLDFEPVAESFRLAFWEPAGKPVAAASLLLLRRVALQFPAVMGGSRILSVRDCRDCPEMAMIPAGALNASAAKPWLSHAVAIPRAFAVAKYPVSRNEYAEFVVETGYTSSTICPPAGSGLPRDWRDPGYRQSPDDPATCMSLTDARAYARWLSEKTHKPYRLLSDDEWVYLVAAGQGAVASPAKTSGGPNRFGLFNMIGEKKEWTDCLANSQQAAGGILFGCDDGLREKTRIGMTAGGGGSKADAIFRVARAL